MINIVVVFEVRTFRVMIRITGIEHDSPVFHIVVPVWGQRET